MKNINIYITEKLKLNKDIINKHQCVLFPRHLEGLVEMIKQEIKENGNECSLNHINVSNITNMSYLFSGYFDLNDFNGDISKWDVSNVTNMSKMFANTKFNGDISSWNVSKVKDMDSMFEKSKFNGDISSWDVSKVKTMYNMFYSSQFNSDISNWKIKQNCDVEDIFYDCPIKNEYIPKLLQD